MALAIFDLDNTLADRDAAFRRWAHIFCAAHELAVDEALDFIIEADGFGNRVRQEFIRDVIARFELGCSEQELHDFLWRHFPGQFVAEPGVADGLARLRAAGWKLGIATNGGAYQVAKLEAAGLHECFDAWCVSSEEGIAKPDPEMLHRVARKLGLVLGPSDWMVGDAEIDVLAGINAGIRTIWLHRGREWANAAYQPNIVAGSTHEALMLIEKSRSCPG